MEMSAQPPVRNSLAQTAAECSMDLLLSHNDP